MKTVALSEFEQDYLKTYTRERIEFVNKVLEYCESSSYDAAENEYRKLLEKLLELEKKLC